jgi:hypothetical protein
MNVTGGIVFMFAALVCAWLGVFYPRANRPMIRAAGPHPRRLLTRTEARLWLATWIVIALGWVGFGVTVLRHSRGPYIDVPASAPFTDQLIYIASLLCITAGFFALAAWMLTNPDRPRLSRRRHPNG